MSEWISVREELPWGEIVDVRRVDGTYLIPVRLFEKGGLCSWKYKSGLYADNLDVFDEWRKHGVD